MRRGIETPVVTDDRNMLFNHYNTRKPSSKTIQTTSFERSTTDQCCNVCVVVFFSPSFVTSPQLSLGGQYTSLTQTKPRIHAQTHSHLNFLKLSLGFLHQTAHQVHFLYCGISPLLFSYKSSALLLKG